MDIMSNIKMCISKGKEWNANYICK